MLERSQSSAHVGSYEVALADSADGPKGTVRWSNETYRIFGYEPGAVPVSHSSFFDHIHPEDREAMRSTSPPTIQRAEPFEHEFRIVRGDGTVRLMHTWTDFERDAAGKPIRMVGTCQDVTERKRAEEELRAADRRKDEFLAMLSHELRNPLAPILNAIEIIERAAAGARRAAHDLPGGHRPAGPAHEAAARRSAGRVARQPGQDRAPQAAGRAVDAAAAGGGGQPPDHAREAAAAGDDARAASRCRWRPTRRASSRCSRTCSTTPPSTPTSAGRITLTSTVEDGEAVVTVRDDGPGMSSELLAAAFDLFVQGTRSFDRAQGGLGIGLTMVRTLVKMHGGSVRRASDGPGRGSEFVVRLPLAPAAALPVARSGRPVSDGLRGRSAARAGRRRQRRRRAGDEARPQAERPRVTLAHDGPAALAAAAADPPELVLLDIGLPGMDGYTVAARLREAGHDRAALVAVTGYGQEEDLRRSTRRRLRPPPGQAGRRHRVAEDHRRPRAPASRGRDPSGPLSLWERVRVRGTRSEEVAARARSGSPRSVRSSPSLK